MRSGTLVNAAGSRRAPTETGRTSLRDHRTTAPSPPRRRRLGPARAGCRDRVSEGGEPSPPRAARKSPAPPDRRPAATTRREGSRARPQPPRPGCHPRHTRHHPALAPSADRGEVDAPGQADRQTWPHEGDPRADRRHGGDQPELGLLPHPGRAEEAWPLGRAVDDREDAEAARCASEPGTADELERVPARPRQRDRGDRLLLRRGLDHARPRHALRAVRHRSRHARGRDAPGRACSAGSPLQASPRTRTGASWHRSHGT